MIVTVVSGTFLTAVEWHIRGLFLSSNKTKSLLTAVTRNVLTRHDRACLSFISERIMRRSPFLTELGCAFFYMSCQCFAFCIACLWCREVSETWG